MKFEMPLNILFSDQIRPRYNLGEDAEFLFLSYCYIRSFASFKWKIFLLQIFVCFEMMQHFWWIMEYLLFCKNIQYSAMNVYFIDKRDVIFFYVICNICFFVCIILRINAIILIEYASLVMSISISGKIQTLQFFPAQVTPMKRYSSISSRGQV